jgi:hypothetical protein
MGRSLVKRSAVKPPQELAHLFLDPPVARTESREDYEGLFAAIAAAVKPADAIAWMYVRDMTDLSWEIRREKSLKIHLFKAAEERSVQYLLSPPPKPFTGELVSFFEIAPPDPEVVQATKEARQWASGDPKIRRKVEKKLADSGDDPSSILSRGLENSQSAIDEIDKRIATYELRRMATLRAIEHYDNKLARRLDAASSKVIDGEFTEAAE